MREKLLVLAVCRHLDRLDAQANRDYYLGIVTRLRDPRWVRFCTNMIQNRTEEERLRITAVY